MTWDTYRARPVEIKAIRWTGPGDTDAVQEFVGTGFFRDVNFASAQVYSTIYQNWMVVKQGDWIARGSFDEFYPVDNKVFTMRYEQVRDLAPALAEPDLGLGAS